MALVCHMKKYKASDCGGIQVEDNRDSEAINEKNNNLDLSKTHLNKHYTYNTENGELEEQKRASFLDIVRWHKWRINMLREAQGLSKLRKDAVVCCSFIVGADPEFMNSLSYEEQLAYFECAVEFFQERYGRNVMEYSIHFDEATPHMHLRLLPEAEIGSLSAKTMFNKTALQELQRELPKYLNEHGFDVEAGKEKSGKKHLNEQEYKIAKGKEQIDALESHIAVFKAELERLNKSIDDAEERLKTANKDVENVENILKELIHSVHQKEAVLQDLNSQVNKFYNALNKCDEVQQHYEWMLGLAELDPEIKKLISQKKDGLYHIGDEIKKATILYEKQSHGSAVGKGSIKRDDYGAI